MKDKKENQKIKQIVREGYSSIASEGCGCHCGCESSREKISREIGYSTEEINNVPEANLGLGCGNPTALGKISEGNVVLDLGSGAGFDAFLAAKKVGKTGKVIGIDMTEKMIEKARENAKKYGYKNVEFVLGDIEEIPLNDQSVDVVISNCVINLTPDKDKVFQESFRVLRKGGRMYVSDIVLLGKLAREQIENNVLLVGCVSGAIQKEDYLSKMKKAGFKVSILGEDKTLSKKQYSGIALESLKLEGMK